jgi:hypothetical protein
LALSCSICGASTAGADSVADVVAPAAADVVVELDAVCADDVSVDVPASDPQAATSPAHRAAPSAMAAALDVRG